MGGYAPRALVDSVRRRRLIGAPGRSLNITVSGGDEGPARPLRPWCYWPLLVVLVDEERRTANGHSGYRGSL